MVCRAAAICFSDAQAQAILELRLQRLTGLERDKIVADYAELLEKIADLMDILARPERITQIIADELNGIRAQFGDKRRSQIEMNTQESRCRGFHHTAGHGSDAVAHRLRSSRNRADRLSCPTSWWSRQAGGGSQGG